MAVWALVGGLTVLFLLAPWLPPKRAGKGTLALTVHPGNRTVTARPGETLLDAGLRAGVALPFECRSGGCGVCKATLLAGDVDRGAYLESALSAAERAQGKLLLCCATALSDVEVEYEEGAAVREAPFGVYAARIERLDRLAHDVLGVALRLVGGKKIAYEAGQYINVILPDGDRRAYSFTTPSGETDLVELQVRRMPGGKFTTLLFDHTKVGDLVRFEGPIGAFILREPSERPLIFVAGATGFAPVKSLLEQAFRMGITRPLHFYWGVRKRRDLYLAELPERWMQEHPNFRFVPVLSEPGPEDEWTGRTGFVHEAILADFPDLSGFAIYACGSVKMVEAAKPAFVAQGLGEEYCFSDAFTAQRPAVVPT
jgi:NAD(P)H-flavin reductase